MKLIDYVRQRRGLTNEVAGRAGLAPAFVSQIANGVRPAPVQHVDAIGRACNGEVRRWDLRPTDWHRIWPELVGAEGAPAVPQEMRDAA